MLYLGSFSKVLAPGLRLGYVVSPEAIYPKLLQAKQAADLHTPSYNQRLAYEVVRGGFLDEHLPRVRALYRERRDAMQRSLTEHMGTMARWVTPRGGMFFWLQLPSHVDVMRLFDAAVASGVAFVPGSAFDASGTNTTTLRLSFVTVEPARIEVGVAKLAAVLRAQSSQASGSP